MGVAGLRWSGVGVGSFRSGEGVGSFRSEAEECAYPPEWRNVPTPRSGGMCLPPGAEAVPGMPPERKWCPERPRLPIPVAIRFRGWPRPLSEAKRSRGHRLGDGGRVSNPARRATAVTPAAMGDHKNATCIFTAVILNGSKSHIAATMVFLALG